MIKLYELSEQYNDFVRAIDSGVEFDADTMSDTLEAIQASFDDKAESIALIYKSLTMEAEAIKTEAKALAEEAKVSIRNVRRDALDLLKIDETMSDDYKKRVEDEIQKVVTESNKSVEDILAEKTKEILSI